MTFELSPSLGGPAAPGAAAPAFELKFHLPADCAGRVEAWARQRLAPDPHGEDGTYAITTLYCDTPSFDVYHRSPGFRRDKHRLRRYGTAAQVYLERKTRQGDRVRKRRDAIDLADLPLLGADVEDAWPGAWFLRRVRWRQLRPACRIAYLRTAFQGAAAAGPVRLTLDRDVTGVPAGEWDLGPVEAGKPLLPGGVILEMKFRACLPELFRELLDELPPTMGRVSKYRLCIAAWGLGLWGTASPFR
jgi:hypothetical protein